MSMVLAQSAPSAAAVFYLTLLFIFLTAVITTLLAKWSRDKCLKLFRRFHVTIEGPRGATDWGTLRVMSSGIEIVYDHPYVDTRGRKKTSLLIYGAEVESRTLTLFRYHDELPEHEKELRIRQVRRTFNPGLLRRIGRWIRNMLNTLRDAFNAAIGAAVGQFQRLNPSMSIIAAQSGQVTQMGQSILGRVAANAYEPLLEQYIGRPVIVDVQDPLNPNNVMQQYGGYLADYTQQFVAVFSVEHPTMQWIELILPQELQGDPLPPMPLPAVAGAAPPAVPPPLRVESDIAIWLDGKHYRLSNLRSEPVVIRRIERQGFEPLALGAVIAPNAFVRFPARDVAGAKVVLESIRLVDVIAPRKYATIRHAGELLEKHGLIEDLGLDQLPFVPAIPRILQTIRPPEDPPAS